MRVTMTVNGEEVTREIEGRLLLVHFLRDHLGLTGTHWGCDTSNCGTCVVWLDDEPVKSCTVLAAMAGGHEVRTVEGLEQNGQLDPIQPPHTANVHGVPLGPYAVDVHRSLMRRRRRATRCAAAAGPSSTSVSSSAQRCWPSSARRSAPCLTARDG